MAVAIVIKDSFFDNEKVVEWKGNYSRNEHWALKEKADMDKSPHKSDFVSVNRIKLHFLDWGGEGETLIFLTGLGNSAHIYDDFAPHFTGEFRVLALTRRGHGDSDCPESGYDVHNLTEDIRCFMDELKIEKTILVGHSMAYVEQCHMSAKYPERISKLVCLDAAYDRTKFKILAEKSPLKDVKVPEQDCDTVEEFIAHIKYIRPDLAEMWNELWEEEIRHTVQTTADGKVLDRMSNELEKLIIDSLRNYVPEETAIKVPVLSFYAIWDKLLFPDYLTDEQKALSTEFQSQIRLPVQRECINQFRQNVPHAKIVETPQGNHYCFITQEDYVFEETRKFLLA